MKQRGWARWAWAVPLVLLVAGRAAAQMAGLVTSVTDAPDPFQSGATTTINVTLSDPAAVTIGIYDPAGKSVRTLCSNLMSKAWSLSVPWDGKDDAGQDVQAATYTYTIRADATGEQDPLAAAASGTVTVRK
jgi:flagellar hook assembly protein FlgD